MGWFFHFLLKENISYILHKKEKKRPTGTDERLETDRLSVYSEKKKKTEQ